ncbi:MAG: polysaccharide deacetylase family protein [Candidatus Binataceae bacterium]
MAWTGSTPLTLLRAGGRLWRAVGSLASARGRGRYLILMYHDVGYGIAPELFKQQMEHLRNHVRVAPLQALVESARSGDPQGTSCAITFDDGYEGVYRHALPYLVEFGFPAMIYLTTDFINDSGSNAKCAARCGLIEGRHPLSWAQVREMDRQGMQFGSHLSRHGDLSVLGPLEAITQLRNSREEIAWRLGKPCEHFAYPFGRLSIQSAGWVREAGYRTAVTTIHRPLVPDDDPFRLPRAGIEDRYSFCDFVRIVRGDWDFIGLLQTLRRPSLRM